MKFGVCVGAEVDKAIIAKRAGFDFVESHCQKIASLGKAELDEFKSAGIPILSANCFIGQKVVGPERNLDLINSYLNELFEKADYIGMRYLVFGSSGARNVPEGQSYEKTYDEIVYFLKECVAPKAKKYGIIIAIEPLRKAESNIINTVSEGARLAKAVDSPNVKLLADVRHMCEEGEDLSTLSSYKGLLVHAHTSNPHPPKELDKGRIFPAPNDGFDQGSFLIPVAEAGVEQCAIEADCIDFETDCAKAMKVLSMYK